MSIGNSSSLEVTRLPAPGPVFSTIHYSNDYPGFNTTSRDQSSDLDWHKVDDDWITQLTSSNTREPRKLAEEKQTVNTNNSSTNDYVPPVISSVTKSLDSTMSSIPASAAASATASASLRLLEQQYFDMYLNKTLTSEMVQSAVCALYWEFPVLLPLLLEDPVVYPLFTDQCLMLLSPSTIMFDKLYVLIRERHFAKGQFDWKWNVELRTGMCGEEILLYTYDAIVNLPRYNCKFPVVYWQQAVAQMNVAILKPLFIHCIDTAEAQLEIRKQLDFALEYVAITTQAKRNVHNFVAALNRNESNGSILTVLREKCLQSCTHPALTVELLWIRENLY